MGCSKTFDRSCISCLFVRKTKFTLCAAQSHRGPPSSPQRCECGALPGDGRSPRVAGRRFERLDEWLCAHGVRHVQGNLTQEAALETHQGETAPNKYIMLPLMQKLAHNYDNLIVSYLFLVVWVLSVLPVLGRYTK